MATSRSKASKSKRKVVAKAAGAPASIALMLNGQAVGQMSLTEAGDQSIGTVANKIAKDHGLKSYSILVNGTKVGTEQAAGKLAGATSIEVFAKETRG